MAKAPAKKLNRKRPRLMKLKDRARLLATFGRRLQKLRRAKGFTPNQFAWESGIDPGNLAKYEQGDREPGLIVIIIMAKALEIDHLKLLDIAFDYEQEY
jgi:transcriptional regulator with XRE-family HTH domain